MQLDFFLKTIKMQSNSFNLHKKKQIVYNSRFVDLKDGLKFLRLNAASKTSNSSDALLKSNISSFMDAIKILKSNIKSFLI